MFQFNMVRKFMIEKHYTEQATFDLTKDDKIRQRLSPYGNKILSRSDIARSTRLCITPCKRPKWRVVWGKTSLLS